MNLTSLKTIKTLCRKYQIYPSKGLGQNFLVDKQALKKLVLAAELQPEDIVLEIGPGIGTLTQVLAKKVKIVLAVEKDLRMVEILGETLKDFRNVEIIQGDILKIQKSKVKIQKSKFKIIGNIPFYLTAPVTRKFLESKAQPELMVFIVQKEVAQRIVARSPKMNLLATSVQFYAQPKIISYVPKSSFWPKPKVDSAIIKIIPHTNKYTPDELLIQGFFKTVKAGFSQPRKQLVNNLSKVLKLDKPKVSLLLLKNNIEPKQRAETLTINDWVNLAKAFDEKKQ